MNGKQHKAFPWISYLLVLLVIFAFAFAPIGSVILCGAIANAYGNTAEGEAALLALSTGGYNTAIGWFSLLDTTTGEFNTAVGAATLVTNTANNNTAIGTGVLFLNTVGEENAGTGFQVLINNTTGSFNTAEGSNALSFNTTGNGNIAVGDQAGSNLTTGDSNIDIGNEGVADEAGTIRIGTQGTQTATFIAGISGATASGGTAVFVDTNGQLGTLTSSARFKDNIKPMDKASEAILGLKPVTFRYKKEIDAAGTSQFGLVAEEVEKVNPSLVVRDKDGRPYSVRYEAVNAMLLNEFLKARRQIDAQQKQIEALAAGLQKVSAQMELNKPAPQTVLNNR